MPGKWKTIILIAVVVLAASVTMGGYESAREGKTQSKEDLYDQIELFSDAVSVIRNDYVDAVDSKKIVYGALKGMLSSLDDFSSFMDPDEFKEITVEARGEFGGIGIEIALKDGIVTVIAPMAGTPAEAAGIKNGDKIVKINGKTTKNMSLSEAVKMMRGEPGSGLVLTVWREKEERVLDISMKRAVIKMVSIKDARLIEDKIGYIRLVEFQEKTADQLEEGLKKLEAQGMDSLILDLRNNPGGLLESAIDVSAKFLPKDKAIVSTKSRIVAQNMLYKSNGKFQHPAYPMAVLVNDGSASASEIVAGALKDNKRAVIVGTRTFGKGSVQTVMPLKDNSALRITTAEYFTPNGNSIRNQGVVPDVAVEFEESAGKEAPERDVFERIEEEKGAKKPSKKETPPAPARDNQLQRAVDLMKAIKVYQKL